MPTCPAPWHLARHTRRSLDLPLDHPFTDEPSPNFPTDGLTFVGLTSLMDPPREGVKEAVAQCHAASVKVFMVTGGWPGLQPLAAGCWGWSWGCPGVWGPARCVKLCSHGCCWACWLRSHWACAA